MTWTACSSLILRRSRPSFRSVRQTHNDASSFPIINIPKSSIYALGSESPILRDVSWTVYPHEAWAVISSGHDSGKNALFGALLSTHRISPAPPPPYGLFPFLQGRDSHGCVRLVEFAHRGRGAGGSFYDFTARYGAMHEEDRRTLRETFFPNLAGPTHPLAIPWLHSKDPDISPENAEEKRQTQELFEMLTDRLGLTEFLDLPMVALSNGQTRRARIIKALLAKPKLLLLDEPLTGLDVKTRGLLLSLLQDYHKSRRSPYIIIGMRAQDPLPEWTTHVALIKDDGTVHADKRDDMPRPQAKNLPFTVASTSSSEPTVGLDTSEKKFCRRITGIPLVHMTGVSVKYGERMVLDSVRWTIVENSRWHLQGANGSGKTTLLALLTGDHPQSYAESARLLLFSRSRDKWATPMLHRRIGRVSPELHNAFPRRHSMSVWDAVGTGFDGGFVPKGKMRLGLDREGRDLERGGRDEEWRVYRMRTVLKHLGPSVWRGELGGNDEEFWRRPFVDLMPGEQSMVLLMRALVSLPPLVLLDEVWSGMDRGMVTAAHRYLSDVGGGLTRNQACVVVSHWEEEVPWGPQHGVNRFRLEGAKGHLVPSS